MEKRQQQRLKIAQGTRLNKIDLKQKLTLAQSADQVADKPIFNRASLRIAVVLSEFLATAEAENVDKINEKLFDSALREKSYALLPKAKNLKVQETFDTKLINYQANPTLETIKINRLGKMINQELTIELIEHKQEFDQEKGFNTELKSKLIINNKKLKELRELLLEQNIILEQTKVDLAVLALNLASKENKNKKEDILSKIAHKKSTQKLSSRIINYYHFNIAQIASRTKFDFDDFFQQIELTTLKKIKQYLAFKENKLVSSIFKLNESSNQEQNLIKQSQIKDKMLLKIEEQQLRASQKAEIKNRLARLEANSAS